MSCNVKIEVLAGYVRVALELFIHACKDAFEDLASIILTLLLIT